jgi:hypothetical protein
VIEKLHGNALPTAQLFDQLHALLELRSACFEFAYVREQ